MGDEVADPALDEPWLPEGGGGGVYPWPTEFVLDPPVPEPTWPIAMPISSATATATTRCQVLQLRRCLMCRSPGDGTSAVGAGACDAGVGDTRVAVTGASGGGPGTVGDDGEGGTVSAKPVTDIAPSGNGECSGV